MPEKPSPPPLKVPASDRTGRDRGWVVVIANQLALPGFGTVLAGRKIGYLQLGFSVTGVLCLTVFLGYAIPHLGELLRQAFHPSDNPDALLDFLSDWMPWLLIAVVGITLFGTAWLWALGTSVKAVQNNEKRENR